MESGNELGQDILKILYASEEEKVAVASDGKLTITSAGGGVERAPKVEVQISDELMEWLIYCVISLNQLYINEYSESVRLQL